MEPLKKEDRDERRERSAEAQVGPPPGVPKATGLSGRILRKLQNRTRELWRKEINMGPHDTSSGDSWDSIGNYEEIRAGAETEHPALAIKDDTKLLLAGTETRNVSGRSLRITRGLLLPSMALLMVVGSASPSFAHRFVGAHVINLQGTLVPTSTIFRLDNPAGSPCSGAWIKWDGNPVNPPVGFDRAASVKTVWAMLLAAQMSGKGLWVYLDDNVCTAVEIYIVND